MPSVYGKTNNPVTRKDYTGINTETAKVKINNQSATISVDVTKLPHSLKIKEVGGQEIEYDGSTPQKITLASDESVVALSQRVDVVESDISDINGKLDIVDEAFEDVDNRIQQIQNIDINQNEQLNTLSSNIITLQQDISNNTTAISNERSERISQDNLIITNAEGIKVTDKQNGTFTFTNYEGIESDPIRTGYPADEDTLQVVNGIMSLKSVKVDNDTMTGSGVVSSPLSVKALKDNVGILTPANIRQDISDLNQEIDAIKGIGGYLIPYDFNTDRPDLPIDDLISDPPVYSLLTQYALSQITNISNPTDIWNGTRITNIYNNHTWILNNTPDTDPAIFEWVDLGQAIVSIATNSTAGIVKASNENLKVSVDNNGVMSVNNLSTELDNKQDTITGGASTITSSNLITDKVLVSDSNGKVTSSNITSVELSYLSNAASNIQEQLNALTTACSIYRFEEI